METPPEELPERPHRRRRDGSVYGPAIIMSLVIIALIIAILALDLIHRQALVATPTGPWLSP